jgi:hypothetical protein
VNQAYQQDSMKKQQWTGYFTALFIFSFASESTELPSKFSNNLI